MLISFGQGLLPTGLPRLRLVLDLKDPGKDRAAFNANKSPLLTYDDDKDVVERLQVRDAVLPRL